MKLDSIKSLKGAVTNKAARQILLTQKHSPKILFVVGVAGVIGTVVLACRATMKTDGILNEHDRLKGQAEIANPDSEERFNKEIHQLQIKTAVEIVKEYLPAVGLGLVSIGALTGSHIILTKRNGTLMAAFVALDRGFNEYRQRIAAEYGVDTERKIAMGGETKTVTEKMADDTTKTSAKTIFSGNGKSPYAALFDEKSTHYSKMPGANPNTLMFIQNHATDKLRARGHLFLNEVYDMLDLPRTPAGQIVGWVYNNDPNHKGDNYVTFGVWDNNDEFVESFMDGHEKSIWLDFNVDGPVYELI